MQGLTPWKNDPSRSGESWMHPFSSFRRELDPLFGRLLDSFWNDGDLVPGDPVRLEVSETAERFVILAEIPGVEPSELDVQLSGDMLILSGEKRQEQSHQDDSHRYSERRYGGFRRAVRLSAPVDPNAVKAEHRNGVVTITLEKSADVRPHRIQVQTR